MTVLGLDPTEYKEKHMELENKKQEVVQYVDENNDGLSFKENYKIKKFKGIEDSSKTYKPTKEEWERAYENIKQEK